MVVITEDAEAETTAAKELLTQKGFTKAYRENAKETNLDKKMNDIRNTLESGKYDELYRKLRDAESKNEYLTSVINQLQTERNTNSAFSRWALIKSDL